MKVYMDVCCLNRPFDDLSQMPFDSLHLALAETGAADVFLTTDDRLIRAASKIALEVKIANPVSWLMEVTNNGQ